MDKQEKINLISLLMVIGILTALLYHYIAGVILGYGYPNNTFLFRPEDRFNDFYNHLNITVDPYIPDRYKGVYFPLFYVLLGLFSKLPAKVLFILVFSAFVICFIGICFHYLKNKSKLITFRNIFIFAFLSYPMIFVLDRGNFEAVIFIFLFLFVYFYPKYPRLSLLFLIYPIAAKATPAIFLLIPLIDKKYKEVIATVLIVGILTLGSYSIFPGGIIANLSNHLINLKTQDQNYLINNYDRELGISLFALIKYFAILLFKKIPEEIISSKIYTFYYPFSILLGLFTAALVYLIKMPYWKKITLIVCAMNLLPTITMDYKLISLFIPIFLFINNEFKQKNDIYYTILFSLLLIPKQYYLPFYNYDSISAVLNPVIMFLLTIQIVKEGINTIILPQKSTSLIDSGSS